MEAYISGTAGMAAVIKGANAELYQVDKVVPVIMKTEVAQQIISSNTDVIVLSNTTKSAALKKLNTETNKTNSLMVFLTILDSAIDDESRISLIEHLDDLFAKDIKAYEYVCNIMFARPLPDNSIQSISDDIFQEKTKVYELLKLLFICQSKIAECSSIFTMICSKRGLNLNQSSYVEGLLVNEGFFYSFSSQQADVNFLNKIHFLLLTKLKVTNIDDYVHLSSCINTDFKPLVNSNTTTKINNSSYQNTEEKEEKYQAKVKKPNNQEAYKRVKTQLASIKKLLREQSILPAKRMAEDLILYQIQTGNNEFAAQSLCQLSEFAKHLNLFDTQLEWALRATEVAPLDYRTFGHAADAYLNLDNILEAEKAFEMCLKGHGDNRTYGLTGLARIERSRSNLPSAMKYIEVAIKECGIDHIPYLIKAELLRDQYKYPESEKVYDFVCLKFPEFSIPQCGKAAVLAEQKKFDEAECTYKQALKNYPNVEDKRKILSSLGFLVAKLGRFDESHKLLDQSITLSTYEDIIPVLSKTKVLQMEGRFKEAEKLLKSLLKSRAQFVDVVEQLLELYIKTNELEKAEMLYRKIDKNLKESDQIQIRYSQLLKQQNNFEGALAIVDKIRAMKPRHTLAMNERASIFKLQGKYKAAQQQYKEVLKVNKFDRRASFGLQAINHIFKRDVKIENVVSTADVINPKTIDDYQTIGNIGLLKLAKGEVKEGKKLLLQSYNSNFKSLQIEFDSGLSLASLMLNQKAAALKPIKRPKSIIALIQNTVVYGEQGKMERVIDNVKKLHDNIPPYAEKIISMINAKYLTAANDEHISQEDIYQEQVKNMLMAA
jgi:tetratricopeptide (TPR) repeat protein